MKLSPTGSYMEALDHARKFRRVQMVIGKDDHRYLVGLQHRHTERGVMVIDEKAYWKPDMPSLILFYASAQGHAKYALDEALQQRLRDAFEPLIRHAAATMNFSPRNSASS